MEAQATIDCAGEPITTRAVDRILAQYTESGKGDDAGQLPEQAHVECRQKNPA